MDLSQPLSIHKISLGEGFARAENLKSSIPFWEFPIGCSLAQIYLIPADGEKVATVTGFSIEQGASRLPSGVLNGEVSKLLGPPARASSRRDLQVWEYPTRAASGEAAVLEVFFDHTLLGETYVCSYALSLI